MPHINHQLYPSPFPFYHCCSKLSLRARIFFCLVATSVILAVIKLKKCPGVFKSCLYQQAGATTLFRASVALVRPNDFFCAIGVSTASGADSVRGFRLTRNGNLRTEHALLTMEADICMVFKRFE